MNLVREYYSVKEAAELLPYSEPELWHSIETGQLHGDLLSPRRRYLAVLFDGERQGIVGIGTCEYKGLIRVHQSWIELLMQAGEIVLNREAEPLSRDKISGWSGDVPFSGQNFPAELAGWDRELSEGGLRQPNLLPLPVVSTSWRRSVYDAVSALAEAYKKANPEREASPLYELSASRVPNPHFYDYTPNGKFAKEDIRLSPECVERLKQPSAPAQGAGSAGSESVVGRIQAAVPAEKQRESQLHQLFYRIMKSGEALKAQDVWNVTKHEAQSEMKDRVYDVDAILRSVDNERILWQSIYAEPGDLQSFKRSSLSPTLSKIKKWDG